MTGSIPFDAFLFGIISAVSLPLGALVSFFWKPKDRIIAFLMAFGGGALLAALTIDLAGPALERGHFYALFFGCITGGLLFDALNVVVNSQGGFLRKTATTVQHLKKIKLKNYMRVFETMSNAPTFSQLPPEEIKAIIPHLIRRKFKAGRVIMHQGQPGDSLFIIESGSVSIIDKNHDNKLIVKLTQNDVFGEIALITDAPRTATAIADTDTHLWMIYKEDFNKLIEHSPELESALKHVAKDRITELKDRNAINQTHADTWYTKAISDVDVQHVAPPSETDIKEASKSHGGAALAIWIGILLDGIPESFVIGSSLIGASAGHAIAVGDPHDSASMISFSLIAGLFLSNFPEALSSSLGMAEQKYSKQKIFWMWTSLMFITGLGALVGYYVSSSLSHGSNAFSFIEGIAAGAMLVMIAETMLPEASHKGGAIIGIATLLGFMAALFCKDEAGILIARIFG
jgi:CRP-like cAMP-binding protein